jgi:hypothetical protein
MLEDVGDQCVDLVEPENLGVSLSFGISTSSSIEREIQLLPVWRRAILLYRCWSMSKGYTAHSENRASTYMRTVNVDFRSARINQFSVNATLNLIYFMQIMLIFLTSVLVARFIMSCDILWAVCYWIEAENAL